MTFEQLKAGGYINELARLFNREAAANLLLHTAKIPPERMPAFNVTPLEFWEGVFLQLENGVVPEVQDPAVLIRTALERYPANRVFKQLLLPPPVVVLYVAANPLDTLHLDQQGEFESIKAAFAPAVQAGRARVEGAWAIQPHRILQELQAHRPTIVHFALHGDEDGRLLLYNNGESTPVDPLLLVNVFQAIPKPDRTTRLVLLNACYSKRAADAIREAVDVVVGWTTRLGDRAALAFTKDFYGWLVKFLTEAPQTPVADAIRWALAAAKKSLPAGPSDITDA